MSYESFRAGFDCCEHAAQAAFTESERLRQALIRRDTMIADLLDTNKKLKARLAEQAEAPSTPCSRCDGYGTVDYPNISGHDLPMPCTDCAGTGQRESK